MFCFRLLQREKIEYEKRKWITNFHSRSNQCAKKDFLLICFTGFSSMNTLCRFNSHPYFRRYHIFNGFFKITSFTISKTVNFLSLSLFSFDHNNRSNVMSNIQSTSPTNLSFILSVVLYSQTFYCFIVSIHSLVQYN